MPSSPRSVLALYGPSASGKTAIAGAIADRIQGEVVSADSMQVYAGLPIITAQPQRATRLVAIWPLSHEATVAEYAQLAHAAVDEILAAGSTPIVAGGTGLYLRAALTDLRLPPPPASGGRERWEAYYDARGPRAAHAQLEERDPEAAAALHENDRRRVVRALELTELGESLVPAEGRLWTEETRHPTLVFGLDVRPEVLAERIERRARAMFDAGAEDEVRAALAAGLISATARYAYGLDEIASLPREQALESMIRRTRRYAAYQRKWMRRIPGLVPIDAERTADEVAEDILAITRERGILAA